MASWLVLDWVNDQFHVLCAQSSRRGVQVTRALTWTHPESFTPSTAESLGKALREFLKSAKVGAAPVIVGLGRDRIFLKELRFPLIAAHEEPNLVRFQTAKEIAEPVDNYAIDYVGMGDSDFERKVMAAACRRDVMQSLHTLCQAAGLKLHAVTPRIFGMGYALARSIAPEQMPPGVNHLSAVLAVGQRWAELSFFRGDRLLLAQSLANGPMLAGELKRNLAVFQAQHAVDINVTGPDQLYVFSCNAALADSLSTTLGIPVQPLNPLKPERDIAEALDVPSQFAGGVGLAQLWSQSGDKPINLALPRKAQAPVSVSRQRLLLVGAVFAAVLLLAIGAFGWLLITERSKNRQLAKEKTEYDEFLKNVVQERADIEAYNEWENTTVPWLDELYDLSARFPFEPQFRINKWSAQPPATRRSGVKEADIGSVTIDGIVPTDRLGPDGLLTNLLNASAGDPHIKVSLGKTKSGENVTEFSLKFDIAKQDIKKYQTSLSVPVLPRAKEIIITKTKQRLKTPEPAKKDIETEPKTPDPDGDTNMDGGKQ